METDQPILEETARQELLALSRATLEGYLATDRIPEWDVVHSVLRRRSGAFVSLHKGEELRGCIGMLSEDHELFRTDIGLIEVDKHGLVITLGNLRGLLLPQVATKYHWDRDTFLAQTCRKAGLPSNAWRDPKVVIQVFEAQVFSE